MWSALPNLVLVEDDCEFQVYLLICVAFPCAQASLLLRIDSSTKRPSPGVHIAATKFSNICLFDPERYAFCWQFKALASSL